MGSFVNPKEKDSIKHLEFELGLARREINNLRKQLKSLTFIHQKECNVIKEYLQSWRCIGCRALDTPEIKCTEVNADETNPSEDEVFKQIGVIHTIFPEKRGTPRQPTVCSDAIAKLSLNNKVLTNPHHALDGLQEFSHLWILFHFHKNNTTHIKAKISPPRLNGSRTGVFATRSPHRPSPIGLSLVKIKKIRGNDIYFSGVDMVDGTPVFDIKPYIPRYDNPNSVKVPEFCAITESTKIMKEDTDVEYVNNTPQSDSMLQGSAHMNSSDCDINKTVAWKKTGGTKDVSCVMDSTTSNSTLATMEELQPNISRNCVMNRRGTPDGEEQECCSSFSKVDHLPLLTEIKDHVRVPEWINQSSVGTFNVSFNENALTQLIQLGIVGEKEKNIIKNVLREDPRSVYLRKRWKDNYYIFRIGELFVSCTFDDLSHTVTVCEVFQDTKRGNDNCLLVLD